MNSVGRLSGIGRLHPFWEPRKSADGTRGSSTTDWAEDTDSHDPDRPEDVLKVDADEDGVGGDDAADSLCYLVARKGGRWRTGS